MHTSAMIGAMFTTGKVVSATSKQLSLYWCAFYTKFIQCLIFQYCPNTESGASGKSFMQWLLCDSGKEELADVSSYDYTSNALTHDSESAWARMHGTPIASL